MRSIKSQESAMHDWSKLIRERLGPMNLPKQIQDEVVSELASHLQDVYEDKIVAGNTESSALEFALGQVDHWRPLAKEIERTRGGIMNNRSKQFWLPALLSLSASMIWLMFIELTAEKLHMPWRYSNVAFMPYVLWIVSLPLIGGLTAYLAYRAGSTRRACFSAVTFPCMVMFVMWLVLVGYLLMRKTPQPIHALSISYGLFFWVLLPAGALLLGTWPFSRQHKVSA
ncbi:MAG TPA: hypothetical protein VLK33_07200 [Terriglobales bacterium]|nr:hypothetical protein [Terriglobales bacterium]